MNRQLGNKCFSESKGFYCGKKQKFSHQSDLRGNFKAPQMNPFLERHVTVDGVDAESLNGQQQDGRKLRLSDRTVIVIVVYLSLFLDNVLLTVIGECRIEFVF